MIVTLFFIASHTLVRTKHTISMAICVIFPSMKGINTHCIEMNWSLIKCFYLLKSVQQEQMGGV